MAQQLKHSILPQRTWGFPSTHQGTLSLSELSHWVPGAWIHTLKNTKQKPSKIWDIAPSISNMGWEGAILFCAWYKGFLVLVTSLCTFCVHEPCAQILTCIFTFSFHVYICLISVYLCIMCGFPGNGVSDGFGWALHGTGELNPGPLEEQQLLTAEPFLQLPLCPLKERKKAYSFVLRHVRRLTPKLQGLPLSYISSIYSESGL